MSNAPRYRLVGYDIGTAPDENGGWVHWTDHEAEIARLIAERDAAMAGAVKVRPLVWSDDYRPVASPQSYQIWPDNGGSGAPDDPIETFDGYMLYSPTMMALGVHPTPEAAKAAAQADYEARILAAIQPDHDAHQAALAVAAIAALRDIDDLVAHSEGVSGLHLNGDIAPWSEIMDGGAYGAWLQSVERLREAILAAIQPADLAESRAYALALEQELRDRAEKAEAERDAALAGAVKAEPLVWENFDAWTYWAKCAFGTYRAQERNGVWKATLQRGDNTELTYEYTTDGLTPGDFEAAQAAAQADYEARILATIQPDPEARQADLARAWTMGRDAAAEWHGEREQDELAIASKYRGGSNPWFSHCQSAKSHKDASDAIRALTPPADLAAKIGGE